MNLRVGKYLLTLLISLLSAVHCFAGDEITLMTHDSFKVSEAVVTEFEQANDVKLRFLKGGDAGVITNQSILSKNNPLADVLFGVDNTLLSRALAEDVFEPYNSPVLAEIDDSLKLDKQNRALPVDYGDVCLNYDKEWFAAKKLAPPTSLEDLIKPAYDGLTVVENPATSSPGLAFLFVTIGRYGEKGYLSYWEKLRDSRLLVVNGWEDAYWGHFSAASKGNRPIVVSYASSPPVEVLFAEPKPAEAPTAAVVSAQSCFRQVEFLGILKGTKNRRMAERLVDFLLSRTYQEDIPLQNFMFPANKNAKLPDVFVKHAKTAIRPVMLSSETITQNREKWIEEWTETVLR